MTVDPRVPERSGGPSPLTPALAAGSDPLASVCQDPIEPSSGGLSDRELAELRSRVPPVEAPAWATDPEGPADHCRNALQMVVGLRLVAEGATESGGVDLALIAGDLVVFAEAFERRLTRAVEQIEGGYLTENQRARVAALIGLLPGDNLARINAAMEATPL
jgi:hypothetical protein